MSTTETVEDTGAEPPKYRRRLRNYLIDVSLQLRFTGFIMLVAVLITAGLGYKMYEATQDTSKVILMTGLVDPASAGELLSQFRENDRVVLWGIVGFGLVLVLSVAGVGIWITHKVAGPLYNIGTICNRVRDNRLAPPLRQLRKGDELQEFYSTFRDMYESLRTRASQDLATLSSALVALEAIEPKTTAVSEAIEQIKALRREKEESLSPPA